MVSNPENASADRDDTPIEVYGDSPDRVAFPVWLTACIKLAPPKRDGKPRQNTGPVYEIALKLLASRESARPDEATSLDRQRLARYVGSPYVRNIQWVFDYLAEVGFLRIYKRPDINGGRKPDRFEVRTRPPANYVGPATDAELDQALFFGESPVRLFSQVSTESLHTQNFGEPRKSSDADVRGVSPGHTESLHTQNFDARARTPSAPSGRSGRERPEGERETTKPAADAAAGTSQSEEIDWARLLVRALPWSQRMPQGRDLRSSDARELAAAFRKAADVHHYTEVQIRTWALDRLRASDGKNPVKWVLNAFADTALDREPVAESLSLPQEPQASTDDTAASADEPRSSQQQPQRSGSSQPEWCGQCGDDPSDEVVARHCRNNPRRRTLPNGEMCPCSGLVTDADAA